MEARAGRPMEGLLVECSRELPFSNFRQSGAVGKLPRLGGQMAHSSWDSRKVGIMNFPRTPHELTRRCPSLIHALWPRADQRRGVRTTDPEASFAAILFPARLLR